MAPVRYLLFDRTRNPSSFVSSTGWIFKLRVYSRHQHVIADWHSYVVLCQGSPDFGNM